MNEQEFMAASDEEAQAYAKERGNAALQSFLSRAKGGGGSVPKTQSDSSAGSPGEGDSMDKAKAMAAIQAGMKGGPDAILAELQKAGLKLDGGAPPEHGDEKEDKEMDKGGGNPFGGGPPGGGGGPPGGGLAAMREKAAGMALDKKPPM